MRHLAISGVFILTFILRPLPCSSAGAKTPEPYANDALPQAAGFEYLPLSRPELYFHPAKAHHHGGGRTDVKETFRDLGKEAYPYFSAGEIQPPKPYNVEARYSKADVERFKTALK
ncbi:MAG: hypothetical protein ABL955_04510 [Elusimicrobiota bacterium]